MPIKDLEKKRKYYRERYHATREQALDYLAMKHAMEVIDLVHRYHGNAAEQSRAVADFLKQHCKFKVGIMKSK